MTDALNVVDVTARTTPDEHAIDEARRVMTICNACRYCEGYCAVFLEMTRHRTFQDHTLEDLSHLCHNCTACFHACQYKPPHEFQVNVPAALSALRHSSYAVNVWPASAGLVFAHNGVFIASLFVVSLLASVMLGLLLHDPTHLFSQHLGAGAFYRVIAHSTIVLLAGVALTFAVVAAVVPLLRLHRRDDRPPTRSRLRALGRTLSDIASLRNMGGGHGEGCNTEDDGFSNRRRLFHQLTAWGFLLCFLSTATATVYELVFGWLSPFSLTSLPVLLGMVGGVGIVAGPIGLLVEHRRMAPEVNGGAHQDLTVALITSLLLVGISGFAVLLLRETQWMGLVLIVHFGWVLAFFLMIPYSKFMHVPMRASSLYRHHRHR